MAMATKSLLVPTDEYRINVSEALSGVVVFGLVANGAPDRTVNFEVKVRGQADGAFQAIQATNLSTGTLVTSATAAGVFRIDASGELEIRARLSGGTTGGFDVTAGVTLG